MIILNFSFVSSNLRELSREKSLIASGQKELASMTMTIKNKLGTTMNIISKIYFFD